VVVLSPRHSLLIAALVGTALWLSRSVLDTTAAGVRIALMPSLPEWLGLIVLAGIGLTLLQALTEHLVGRRRPGAQLSFEALLPLALLGLLALPYLPVLPDRIPILATLAGPLRWWVWSAAVVAAAWAFTLTIPPREVWRASRFRPLWPGLATAGVVAVAMSQLAAGPIYPGSDEAHYLVVTQSVLTDGDLRIDDNHARGDYRAYSNGALKPDAGVPPGPDGAIYSLHPVGTSLLVAPGFAWAGYRGAAATVLLIATAVGLLLWRALRNLFASTSAATFGWLAVITSAPFVLHGFAILPEVPAALAVVAALWWRSRPDTRLDAVMRGLAVGVLPWLGLKYAPVAVTITLLLVARAPRDRARLTAIGVPVVLSLAAWLAWFGMLWGSPLPRAAPYVAAHRMGFGNLAAGLPGLFFDQEYGVVAVAPALAMAVAGWWHLWRRGGTDRRLALETSAPLATLALTVAAYPIWWGGSASPGQQVTAALPLLGVPLAALWRDARPYPVRQAVLVMLLAIGIAATATFIFAQHGLLIANGRDGISDLLDYLAQTRVFAQMSPSFIADRAAPGRPLLLTSLWAAAAAAVWWAAGRGTSATPGRASLAGGGLLTMAVLLVSVVAPSISRRAAELIPPAQHAALDHFDADARPVAIVFDPMRLAAAPTVPGLMHFVATPGLRRAPQPVRVLHNLRLALPAGRYRADFTPNPGATLEGDVGLQVGRIGPPQQIWAVSALPGTRWAREFDLVLDTNFVGFRGDAALESAIARIDVTPIAVVDARDRLRRPPVTATAVFGGQPAYFHDTHADVEAAGFWARGRTTTELTVGVPQDRQPRVVRLKIHSGQAATTVRVATPVWTTHVALTPGEHASVVVPALDTQSLLALSITPAGGFVPAEHGGPPADRRLLGCWVEVVP
jgi:hypothetical protein